jgi:hypothetical protein
MASESMNTVEAILNLQEARKRNSRPAYNYKSDYAAVASPAPAARADADSDADSDPAPAPAYARPDVLDEKIYDDLQRKGFTPEAIAKAYAPYNPGEGQSYIDHIAQLSAPRPPDRQRMRANAGIAAIGDALRTVAELAAANQGARVGPRTGDASSAVAKYNDSLRKRYEDLTQNHDTQMFNARLRAFTEGARRHDAGRAAITGAIERKQRQDAAEANSAARLEIQRQSADSLADYRNRTAADTAEYRNRMASASEARTKSQVARNSAYIAGQTAKAGGGTKAKAGGAAKDTLYIMAHPDDPNAVTDGFGQRVVAYPLEKGQREMLYREGVKAMEDGTLNRQNHPELFERKKSTDADMLEAVLAGKTAAEPAYVPVKDKNAIAAAYASMLYGQRMGGRAASAAALRAPATASTAALPYTYPAGASLFYGRQTGETPVVPYAPGVHPGDEEEDGDDDGDDEKGYEVMWRDEWD